MKTNKQLSELFKAVTGRLPVGLSISDKEQSVGNQRLGVRLKGLSSFPAPFIPELFIGFLRKFGGEDSLVGTYFFIRSVNDIGDGLGHIVIATNPRSAISIGVSHHMLEFDDPYVSVAPTSDIDDVFAWEPFCKSLDECLLQLACKNLCESLPYDLQIDDVTTSHILEEVSIYPRLSLTRSGENGIHFQPHYTEGTIICLDQDDDSALIGFDSLERALAFQAKHDWDFAETLE